MPKYIVVGAGVSGEGVVKTLNTSGETPFLYTDDNVALNGATKLNKITKEHAGLTAIVSPGIKPRHKIYRLAKKFNIKTTCELEVFGSALKGTTIGVTGTNGKTTTTMLITALLTGAGKNAKALGNIGASIALASLDTQDADINVIEESSFMLEKIENFKQNISVFLNFSPDHLNYHKNLSEYFSAKCKMFKNQNEADTAVLNYDAPSVCALASVIKPRVVFFSTQTELENGAYVKDGIIYYSGEEVLSTQNIKLKGEHNLQNILASVAVAKLCGVENEVISEVIKNFEPLEHRLEKITTSEGLVFYNSSKATNIASALTDIKAVPEPNIVLFGGSHKGENYNELFKNNLPNTKVVICFGASGKKIYGAANKCKTTTLEGVQILKVQKFAEAVGIAANLAKAKSLSVVLAPACASFDEFKNYKERGDEFKKIAIRF